MRKILLLFVFVNSIAYGQLKRFSIQLAPNYSIIGEQSDPLPSTLNPSNSGFSISTISPYRLKESYDSRMGISLKTNFDYQFSNNYFFSSGLRLDYIRFRRQISVIENNVTPVLIRTDTYQFFPSPSRPINIEEPEQLGESTVLYLQIPFLVGTTFLNNKLLIKVGASFSFLARATVHKMQYSYNYSQNYSQSSIYNDKTGDGWTNTIANAVFDATYLITKNVGIDLNYQRSISPIYDEGNQFGGKAKYNIISLGVSYTTHLKKEAL